VFDEVTQWGGLGLLSVHGHVFRSLLVILLNPNVFIFFILSFCYFFVFC
jgi:hypothetical protein